MGLGLHGGGIGATNYFSSLGARIVVTDLKTEGELEESIAKLRNKKNIRFVLGRHDFKDFRSADLVIKNPGVPHDSPYLRHALEHGVPVETDIGIFLDSTRKLTYNIVGVTGTKGKSTTATLLHKIVQSRYPDALIGGNITGSVLDVLDQVKRDSYVVLELSSFQLGGIAAKRFSPRLSIFTNFMEDHLNYYLSMDEYFMDKSVLYRFQGEGDVVVVNRDNRAYDLVKPARGARLISFGMNESFEGEGSFSRNGKIFYRKQNQEHEVMSLRSIHILGIHNLYNVLAAVAAACHEGFNPQEIDEAVGSLHGIEHRLEYVGISRGVRFFNDSAATIPQAAIQGIRSFSEKLTLIAGGADKNLELSEFIRTIENRVLSLVLLGGSGTERLVKSGLKKEYRIHDNLQSAVCDAFLMTPAGGVVLLSPGFASFGMFKNEFHRGKEFKKIVMNISTGEGECHEEGQER